MYTGKACRGDRRGGGATVPDESTMLIRSEFKLGNNDFVKFEESECQDQIQEDHLKVLL